MALYPVPVRVTNLKTATGDQPNEPYVMSGRLCSPDDVLTRRFFLFDTVSAVAEGGDVPVVIRYASELILTTMLTVTAPSAIFAPVLTITYSEASTAAYSPTKSFLRPMRLEGRYTMDTTRFFTTLTAWCIVALTAACALFTIKYFAYRRRNTRVISYAGSGDANGGVTMEFCAQVSVLAMTAFVQIFFPLFCMLCFYWFTFFKLQSTGY
jgi:hypothetical protein